MSFQGRVLHTISVVTCGATLLLAVHKRASRKLAGLVTISWFFTSNRQSPLGRYRSTAGTPSIDLGNSRLERRRPPQW